MLYKFVSYFNFRFLLTLKNWNMAKIVTLHLIYSCQEKKTFVATLIRVSEIINRVQVCEIKSECKSKHKKSFRLSYCMKKKRTTLKK